MFSHIFTEYYYEMGLKKVASPATAIQWHGHRYKHPIAIPCPIRYGGGWLSLPLLLLF